MNTKAAPGHTAESKGCRFASCVQLFVDGELDPGRAMDVETHLADCEPCAERAELLRALKGSLRRKCEGRATESLRARISLAVVKEAALEAGASEATPSGDTLARDSLLHGLRESRARGGPSPSRDAERAQASARSSRVAYGVGALALAAGVALAFMGERIAGRDGGPTANGPNANGTGTNGTGANGMGASGTNASDTGANGTDRGMPELSRAGGLGLAGAPVGGAQLVDVPSPTSPAGPGLTITGRGVEDRTTFDTMLDDLAALHANPLPPETTNPDELRKFEPIVGVKLRRPTLRSYDARFRGARLHAMRDTQRAAMLQYILRNDHRVTVYLFDPRAIPFGATRLQRRLVKEEPVYVGSFRGYSVAAAERRGIGYAVATDLDTDESVKMVASALP